LIRKKQIKMQAAGITNKKQCPKIQAAGIINNKKQTLRIKSNTNNKHYKNK